MAKRTGRQECARNVGPRDWPAEPSCREPFRPLGAHVTVAGSVKRDESESQLGLRSNRARLRIEPLPKSLTFRAHLQMTGILI